MAYARCSHAMPQGLNRGQR